MSVKFKGYVLGIIAAATYGMNPLFALPLYESGMDVNSVLFFRYIFAIIIVSAMLWWRRRPFSIPRRLILPALGMGLLMGLSSLGLFESYNYMAASIASTLLFVYPLMVALIMWAFYGERLTLSTVFCLAMALGGIALLYKGEDGATLSLAGTLFVVFSSLAYAIYITGVNRPRFKHTATLTLTFYVLVAGFMIFALKAAATGSLVVPRGPLAWSCVAALGLLPTAVSLLCTTMAIQYIGSTPTAILGVFEPVTAIFIGLLVFGESLTPRDMAGVFLIMTAVSVVVSGGKLVPSHLVNFRKLFPRLPGMGRR